MLLWAICLSPVVHLWRALVKVWTDSRQTSNMDLHDLHAAQRWSYEPSTTSKDEADAAIAALDSALRSCNEEAATAAAAVLINTTLYSSPDKTSYVMQHALLLISTALRSGAAARCASRALGDIVAADAQLAHHTAADGALMEALMYALQDEGAHPLEVRALSDLAMRSSDAARHVGASGDVLAAVVQGCSSIPACKSDTYRQHQCECSVKKLAALQAVARQGAGAAQRIVDTEGALQMLGGVLRGSCTLAAVEQGSCVHAALDTLSTICSYGAVLASRVARTKGALPALVTLITDKQEAEEAVRLLSIILQQDDAADLAQEVAITNGALVALDGLQYSTGAAAQYARDALYAIARRDAGLARLVTEVVTQNADEDEVDRWGAPLEPAGQQLPGGKLPGEVSHHLECCGGTEQLPTDEWVGDGWVDGKWGQQPSSGGRGAPHIARASVAHARVLGSRQRLRMTGHNRGCGRVIARRAVLIMKSFSSRRAALVACSRSLCLP